MTSVSTPAQDATALADRLEAKLASGEISIEQVAKEALAALRATSQIVTADATALADKPIGWVVKNSFGAVELFLGHERALDAFNGWGSFIGPVFEPRATSQTPDAVREQIAIIIAGDIYGTPDGCVGPATRAARADGFKKADAILALSTLSTPSASAGPQAEAAAWRWYRDGVIVEISEQHARHVFDRWNVLSDDRGAALLMIEQLWAEIDRLRAHPQPQQADGRGTDPFKGLDERLDRLLLTASDNSRFVLSTESAKNIVGIVREWLRPKSGAVSADGRGAQSDYVLMPREATRAMTMAGCDSLPSCEHVFGHAGEMLRNAYRKMVQVGQQPPATDESQAPNFTSQLLDPTNHPD